MSVGKTTQKPFWKSRITAYIYVMDAVYFSMMTSSTIACGDNYPITDAGRAVAVIQAMTSLIFLGLFFNFFNNRLKD